MGHVIEYNDIVIESLLLEIIGTKNLAGYDLSWNFTEAMTKFGFLRELGEIHLYILEERPITALQTPDSDWSLFWYIEMNFSKFTEKNQIFRNDCLHSLSPL